VVTVIGLASPPFSFVVSCVEEARATGIMFSTRFPARRTLSPPPPESVLPHCPSVSDPTDRPPSFRSGPFSFSFFYSVSFSLPSSCAFCLQSILKVLVIAVLLWSPSFRPLSFPCPGRIPQQESDKLPSCSFPPLSLEYPFLLPPYLPMQRFAASPPLLQHRSVFPDAVFFLATFLHV